jgi:dipeptidyl aminopeptidase/acylaminoacyl peptidase
MKEQTRFDRVLPGLFDELAAVRIPDYLEAAIDRASSRTQRPAWTYRGRWLPMQITTEALPTARAPLRLIGVLALIGVLIALAIVAYVGSRPAPTVMVPSFGPAGNGVIALEKDGDIFVADRPGGDLRPLVAGPENDGAPMFSPDGTKLAFMRSIDAQHDDSALMIADADGTNVVQVATEASLGAESRSEWSFAPDGRSLMAVAQIAGEKRVVIRPVDPAAALSVLDVRLPGSWMEISQHGGPSFRPTNPQEILVVAHVGPWVEPSLSGTEGDLNPYGLYVYDLATGGFRTIVDQTDDKYVQDVAWLPDGEHIIYTLGFDAHIVAADGSGDRAFGALRGRISPLSNDGTRIVADRDIFKVGEADTHPGDDSYLHEVVVPIDGEGEPVQLACGLRMKIECSWSWIWSPDDSMLIGTVPHEGPTTYLQADPDTGQVTELDWVDVGTPAWQRVAP